MNPIFFYDIQGVSNIKTSEADHVFEPIEHTPKSATVLTEMLQYLFVTLTTVYIN